MTKQLAGYGSLCGYSKYDPERHPERIVEVMSSGPSFYQFCREEEICEGTFRKWLRDYPEFNKAYKLAKMQQKSSFEERILDAMDNPGANLNAILAGAKMVAGMSVNRTVRLKGYKSKGTFADHYECLLNNMANGHIDIPEAKSVAEVLLVGAKLIDSTENTQRIEALEKIAGMGNGG